MLRAVLFDLDGTLLDLDGEAFLDAYTHALTAHMARVVDPEEFERALLSAAVPTLVAEHPGRSNREVFWEALASTLGVPRALLEEEFARFNAGDLSRILPGGGPRPGAAEAVEAALRRGLKVAVATAPIYPRPVVDERLRRARLDHVPWSLVATDELHSTKPHVSYFVEMAERLGVAPEECLMVGDDYFQDLPARRAGMATYYVGRPLRGLDPGPRGDLRALGEALHAGHEPVA